MNTNLDNLEDQFDNRGFFNKILLLMKSILNLYINPKKFFEKNNLKKYLFAATWIVGISQVIDNIDSKLSRLNYNSVFNFFIDSWLAYFSLILILGLISGQIVYYIRGFWYNLRLKWCSIDTHDEEKGREIFIYTSLISSIPGILISIVYPFFFSNYREAFYSDSIFELILIIFPVWAIINSYITIKHNFDLKNSTTVIWFLILPIISYTGLILLTVLTSLS